jgi:hypothetical protein
VAIALSILCALALAGVGASWFAFIYAKALVDQRTTHLRTEMASSLQAAQASLEALKAEVRDFSHQPAVAAAPGTPRPGMNLTTRSQVLRMHRRGEAAGEIARNLAIPRQEVDLLLKVHRIVLDSMDIHDRRSEHLPGSAEQTLGIAVDSRFRQKI